MNHLVTTFIFLALSAGLAAQAQFIGTENSSIQNQHPMSSAENLSREEKTVPDPQFMDIWGTCYFYRDCQGNAIGLGKTGAECTAQGGHSLDMPNHGCFNF